MRGGGGGVEEGGLGEGGGGGGEWRGCWREGCGWLNASWNPSGENTCTHHRWTSIHEHTSDRLEG